MTDDSQNNEYYLDLFAISLMREKGLLGLNEQIVEEIKEDLISRMLTFINLAILESMPQDKLVELGKLLNTTTQQEDIEEFYRDNITDFNHVIEQALQNFRNIYLDTYE